MRNILTAILLLAALTVAAQNYSPCYKEKYEAGVALYNKGDYNGAKAKFVAAKGCPMPNTKEAETWIGRCNKMLNPQHLSCGTVTDVDGNTYNTVQIGQQCWIRENLRTKHYADGTPIPTGDNVMSDTVPYYYDFSTSKLSLAKRGYLYNWSAAMHGAASSSVAPSGVQGICPTGWHLPSNAEWDTLITYVSSQSKFRCKNFKDSEGEIASSLASTSGWHKSTWGYGGDGVPCDVGNNQSSNNATGFCAFPAGYYYYSSLGHSCYYGSDGVIAGFWSATEYYYNSGTVAYLCELKCESSHVQHNGSGEKREGYSVRCLRD